MSDEPTVTVKGWRQGIETPEGMSLAAFNGHPVTRVLKGAAHHGDFPSVQKLDELKLSDADRGRIDDALEAISEPRGRGSFIEGWRKAEEAAAEIVGALPESQRDPGYLDGPPPPEPTDPAELARDLPRV